MGSMMKRAIVIGASSGIGRATAIECSKMGATVIINGRNKERLQETLSQMVGEGHIVAIGDLTESASLVEMVGIYHVRSGHFHNLTHTLLSQINPLDVGFETDHRIGS